QLCVAAMAVQNALEQISFPGAPSTTVMTTNLARFIVDAGEALLGKDAVERAEGRRRASETWQVIIGFTAGAGLGAACFAVAGLKSLGLPAGLALLALLISQPGVKRVDLHYNKAKESVESGSIEQISSVRCTRNRTSLELERKRRRGHTLPY